MSCPKTRRPLPTRIRGFLAAAAILSLPIGCEMRSAEERGREVAERIQQSIPDIDAAAMEQEVDGGVIAEVQRQLSAVYEYQGEIHGKLDSVTVNAIQAFQRSAGLRDDGILDERTRTRLATAAARRSASP